MTERRAIPARLSLLLRGSMKYLRTLPIARVHCKIVGEMEYLRFFLLIFAGDRKDGFLVQSVYPAATCIRESDTITSNIILIIIYKIL